MKTSVLVCLFSLLTVVLVACGGGLVVGEEIAPEDHTTRRIGYSYKNDTIVEVVYPGSRAFPEEINFYSGRGGSVVSGKLPLKMTFSGGFLRGVTSLAISDGVIIAQASPIKKNEENGVGFHYLSLQDGSILSSFGADKLLFNGSAEYLLFQGGAAKCFLGMEGLAEIKVSFDSLPLSCARDNEEKVWFLCLESVAADQIALVLYLIESKNNLQRVASIQLDETTNGLPLALSFPEANLYDGKIAVVGFRSDFFKSNEGGGLSQRFYRVDFNRNSLQVILIDDAGLLHLGDNGLDGDLFLQSRGVTQVGSGGVVRSDLCPENDACVYAYSPSNGELIWGLGDDVGVFNFTSIKDLRGEVSAK